MRPSTLKLAGAVLLLSLLFLYQNAQGQDKGIGMVAIVEYRDGHREMCVPQEQGFWDRINPFSDVGTNVYKVDGTEVTALYMYSYLRATPKTGQVLAYDYYYNCEVVVDPYLGLFFRSVTYWNGAYRYTDKSGEDWMTAPTSGTYWDAVGNSETPITIYHAQKLKTENVPLAYDENYVYIPLNMNENADTAEIMGMDIHPLVFNFDGTVSFAPLQKKNNYDVDCNYTVVVTDGTDEQVLTASASFVLYFED